MGVVMLNKKNTLIAGLFVITGITQLFAEKYAMCHTACMSGNIPIQNLLSPIIRWKKVQINALC